jgi:hypothetical protein
LLVYIKIFTKWKILKNNLNYKGKLEINRHNFPKFKKVIKRFEPPGLININLINKKYDASRNLKF